jgi:hypothetical protein
VYVRQSGIFHCNFISVFEAANLSIFYGVTKEFNNEILRTYLYVTIGLGKGKNEAILMLDFWVK